MKKYLNIKPAEAIQLKDSEESFRKVFNELKKYGYVDEEMYEEYSETGIGFEDDTGKFFEIELDHWFVDTGDEIEILSDAKFKEKYIEFEGEKHGNQL